MEAIEHVILWTGWKRAEVRRLFCVSSSQISRWKQEKPVHPCLVHPFHILDEEVQRIFEFRTSSEENRNMGYRKFTWLMVDEGVAFLTESSVYRILSMFKLLGKAFKENDVILPRKSGHEVKRI